MGKSAFSGRTIFSENVAWRVPIQSMIGEESTRQKVNKEEVRKIRKGERKRRKKNRG